ncbi:MAG: hypothetical protein ACI8Z5_001778 [Lentimonas sp.]|jgi:hypothetical protein
MMSAVQASWFTIDTHALHVVTLDGSNEDTKHNASVVKTLSLIVIFSLDSILSAMAITKIT